MRLLSSLIVSPRAGKALYKGIDEFCISPEAEVFNPKTDEKHEVKVVYPFYQYGEYGKYDPEHANYYLPGSSIKGALQQKEKELGLFMTDDVMVPNEGIVLRTLCKAQHTGVEEKEKAELKVFFDNVGIEMIKEGTNLEGELYLEDSIEFADILAYANKDTTDKMNQMCKYIQSLLMRDYENEELKISLNALESKLSIVKKASDVILLGGYKGLLHSILLGHDEGLSGGLFIDFKTMLPHGIVKIMPNVNM